MREFAAFEIAAQRVQYRVTPHGQLETELVAAFGIAAGWHEVGPFRDKRTFYRITLGIAHRYEDLDQLAAAARS